MGKFKSHEQLYTPKGEYILDEEYQEILKLQKMLEEHKIPHTIKRFLDGWQIHYPHDDVGCVMDAIETFGSYGSENDLLEIMGLLTPEEEAVDSVLGCLTAEEVFKRIKQHYEKNLKGTNNGQLKP